jgi:F-type H+-transporting ATPase subunit d
MADPLTRFFLLPLLSQLSDIDKAEPRISKTVETMVKKGKWTVDGYSEKFGNLSVM